jgi:allophanate hydrolase subunit 2
VGAASSGTTEVVDLRLLPAPRGDALQLAATELADLEWTVSPASDRIGVRLEGPSLRVTPQRHSEPLVRGAVQVPPSGQPVIMGPDHPTTGGYPVIGVVADADTDALAQARPGTRVRLTPDWG